MPLPLMAVVRVWMLMRVRVVALMRAVLVALVAGMWWWCAPLALGAHARAGVCGHLRACASVVPCHGMSCTHGRTPHIRATMP